MASQEIVQETEGDYRNSKGVFVKGVRMNHLFAYKTGFKDFIDEFQTRHDDVFIVGHPRSGKGRSLGSIYKALLFFSRRIHQRGKARKKRKRKASWEGCKLLQCIHPITPRVPRLTQGTSPGDEAASPGC